MYVRHRSPLVCLTLELHFPIVVHIEKQSNTPRSQLFGHTAFPIVGSTKLFHLLHNTYIFFTARRKSHPVGHYHAVMVLLTAFQRLTETVIAHKLPASCKNMIHPHSLGNLSMALYISSSCSRSSNVPNGCESDIVILLSVISSGIRDENAISRFSHSELRMY